MNQSLRSIRPLLRSVLPAILVLAASGAVHAQTYWFESYQRAVDLIDEGKPEEAASLLAPIIEQHPLPEASLRIPGQQFLDYLPYFQRARIEARMGQYDRAAHSLDVSEAFGAVHASKRPKVELARLRQELESARVSTRTPVFEPVSVPAR